MIARALLLSLLVAACSDDGTDGCTEENIRAAIDSCRVGLPGATAEVCSTSATSADIARELVPVCEAVRAGAEFECLAERASECAAAIPDDRPWTEEGEAARQAIVDECAGEPDPENRERGPCFRACYEALDRCTSVCPEDEAACVPCAGSCRDELVGCLEGCG